MRVCLSVCYSSLTINTELRVSLKFVRHNGVKSDSDCALQRQPRQILQVALVSAAITSRNTITPGVLFQVSYAPERN